MWVFLPTLARMCVCVRLCSVFELSFFSSFCNFLVCVCVCIGQLLFRAKHHTVFFPLLLLKIHSIPIYAYKCILFSLLLSSCIEFLSTETGITEHIFISFYLLIKYFKCTHTHTHAITLRLYHGWPCVTSKERKKTREREREKNNRKWSIYTK